MRNNLAMQTFLLNDVANTLEGGVEDIKEAYEKGSSVPVGPNSEIKFTQTPQGNTGVKLIQTRNSEISEDELKGAEDQIQKLTDKYVANIDKAVEAKTKEILTV